MSHPSFRITSALLFAATLTVAACGRDAVAPDAGRTSVGAPSLLLGPGEYSRTITDTTDAAGNHTMVTEFAAGIYTLPDGQSGSVGSVTVKTYIPGTGVGTSGYCITSTVVGVETIPGWSYSVKKPGGCDKEIVVAFANPTTGEKAEFRYLYIAGKTRIDAGAVN